MTSVYDIHGTPVTVYDTTGRIVWGATSGGGTAPAPTPNDPPTPPTGPTLNIGTRCAAANNGATPAGGTTGTMTATRHVLTVDTTGITLEWVTTYGYGYDQPATMRAAVTINDGPLTPVTVNGAQDWRVGVAAGKEVITTTSDPISLDGYAGDVLAVHVWAKPDAAGSISADLTRVTSSDTTATGDWGTALNALAPATTGGWSYRPARVLAPTNRTAWLAVGDSIAQQPWSYPEQALDARGLAGVKSAQGGDAHVYYPDRWHLRCAPHVPASPNMIDQFGINGSGGLRTSGLAFWKYAKANGVEYLVKTTVCPVTGPSEATISRPGLIPDNAWLRDGAPITADKSTALDPGTTDPGAIRCDVVRPDGTIRKGAGGHPIDVVSDTAAAIEGAEGRISADVIGLYGNDLLHPPAAIHAILGQRLARDLQLLGY